MRAGFFLGGSGGEIFGGGFHPREPDRAVGGGGERGTEGAGSGG